MFGQSANMFRLGPWPQCMCCTLYCSWSDLRTRRRESGDKAKSGQKGKGSIAEAKLNID